MTGIFRLHDILTECKEGMELKKALNPHFGKKPEGITDDCIHVKICIFCL